MMTFRWAIGIVIVLLMFFSATVVNASRLRLRPLTGEEVHRILKDAGREDVIPEGRIVTQGIAAVSGFALGLKSGIAIPLAIGLATANSTQQYLNNINYTAIMSSFPTIPPITLPTFNVSAITSNMPTINMTALTNLFKGGSSNTGSVQYTTQEICFNSRSLNEIDDDNGEDSDDDVEAETEAESGRQLTATSPILTATTSPTSTGAGTGTGLVTMTNDGLGTGTDSLTTTQTGGGGSVNCIVIQKPVVG